MYDIGFHFCAAPHCVCNESCQRLVWHVRMSYSRCAWHGFRFCVAPASVRSASCHTCMRHVTSALSLSWVMSHLQESCHTCRSHVTPALLLSWVMRHESWLRCDMTPGSWRHVAPACVMPHVRASWRYDSLFYVTAPEASWDWVFDPCTPRLFDLYHYSEQNGYFGLVPEHAPGPSS